MNVQSVKIPIVFQQPLILKKYHETKEFDEKEIYPYRIEGLGKNLIPGATNFDVIDKFVKVTDEDIVGISTPIDNIKHLQGAVRLIRRSLTDSNPVLSLLNAYTLFYIGVKDNQKLKTQATQDYIDGLTELAERHNLSEEFWEAHQDYHQRLQRILQQDTISSLIDEMRLTLYHTKLTKFADNYLK